MSKSGTRGTEGESTAPRSENKLRWHSPAFRRLDVNLTGGNLNNPNQDTSGKGGTSHS